MMMKNILRRRNGTTGISFPPYWVSPYLLLSSPAQYKKLAKKKRVTPSGEHQQKTNYKLTGSNTDLICWSAAFFQFYSFLHCGVIFLCWFFLLVVEMLCCFLLLGLICLFACWLAYTLLLALLCSRFGFSFTACVACVLRSSSSSSYSTLCVFWRELKCLSARRLRACVRV